jgi:recombinational DNA repair protein (RecF pathway)
MKQVLTTHAIVINKLVLNESDLIITFFTKKIGKIKLFAKSAKKSKKRFPGGLDIFDHGEIIFQEEYKKNDSSANQLQKLQSFIPFSSFKNLSSNLLLFTAACLILESLQDMTVEENTDSQAIFELTIQTISELDINNYNEKQINSSNNEHLKTLSLLSHYLESLLYITGFIDLNPTSLEQQIAELDGEKNPLLLLTNRLRKHVLTVESITHKKLKTASVLFRTFFTAA